MKDKFQIPNSKFQTNSNNQNSKRLKFENWKLKIGNLKSQLKRSGWTFHLLRSIRTEHSYAFTVIEMILTTFIILMLLVLTFVNYRKGAQTNTLNRVSTRIAQDLRRAQNLALTSLAVGGQAPCAFGIYYNASTNPTSYVIFTDLDPNPTCSSANKTYDPAAIPTELYEQSSIEPGTIISLVPSSPLNIVFVPPDPTTYINGVNSGTALIQVCLSNDLTQCKNVVANSSGLVEVQ